MAPEQIQEAIEDRFGRWGKFLRENDATPSVIVGLGWPGRCRGKFELVVTCPEEMTEEMAIRQLQAAIALLKAGKVQYR